MENLSGKIYLRLINLNSKSVNHDYKLAYKLSERHLTVEGTTRMNVKLATQLFSNTVAKAISFCGEQKFIENYNWQEVKI